MPRAPGRPATDARQRRWRPPRARPAEPCWSTCAEPPRSRSASAGVAPAAAAAETAEPALAGAGAATAGEALVDLLAGGAHRVLLRVAARSPDLAAQRHDRLAGQRRGHDLVLLHIVGVAVVVTGLLLTQLLTLEDAGARRRRGLTRVAGGLGGTHGDKSRPLHPARRPPTFRSAGPPCASRRPALRVPPARPTRPAASR